MWLKEVYIELDLVQISKQISFSEEQMLTK